MTLYETLLAKTYPVCGLNGLDHFMSVSLMGRYGCTGQLTIPVKVILLPPLTMSDQGQFFYFLGTSPVIASASRENADSICKYSPLNRLDDGSFMYVGTAHGSAYYDQGPLDQLLIIPREAYYEVSNYPSSKLTIPNRQV